MSNLINFNEARAKLAANQLMKITFEDGSFAFLTGEELEAALPGVSYRKPGMYAKTDAGFKPRQIAETKTSAGVEQQP